MLYALSKTIGVGSVPGAYALASHGFTARFLVRFHSTGDAGLVFTVLEDAVQAVGGTA